MEGDLLLTSCQSGQQFTACLWDYKTGNALNLYKNGGSTSRNSIGRIKNDLIISIEQQKPLLRLWCINGKEQPQNFKMVLPEPASNLTVSPDNCYIALSFGTKLGIWQLNSGNLLYYNQKHFQPITCIKFCNESSFISTGGKDGMLVTYNFGNLIDLQNNYFPQSNTNLVEPLYCRTDHTSSITDIHVGNFESKSRLITVSDDKTAIIYNLTEGQPILRLVFNHILTAVICNNSFLNVFIGTSSGLIEMISTKDAPRSLVEHVSDDKVLQFIGHEKKINCLSLNMTNTILASGSDDSKLFLWDIASRTPLRTIEHKSGITNVIFTPRHVNMFNDSYKPQVVINTMQKTFNDSNLNTEISILQTEDIQFSDEEDFSMNVDIKLQEKCNNLKLINKQLYDKLIQINMK